MIIDQQGISAGRFAYEAYFWMQIVQYMSMHFCMSHAYTVHFTYIYITYVGMIITITYKYIYMYMYDYWRIATIYISSTHIDLISESLPASAQEAAGLGSASRRSQAGGVWMAADGFPLKSHEEIVELASKWFHRHCEVDLPLLNGSTNKTMVS